MQQWWYNAENHPRKETFLTLAPARLVVLVAGFEFHRVSFKFFFGIKDKGFGILNTSAVVILAFFVGHIGADIGMFDEMI